MVDILSRTKFITKLASRASRRSFNLIKPMTEHLEMKELREKRANRAKLWSSMK